MTYVKVCLCSVLIVLLNGSILHGQEQTSLKSAQRHFDRARWLEANSDPAAEQEYKLAIEARNGSYAEAWQGLERFYAAQLRFFEASTALQNYISLTPKMRHEGDVEELLNLRQAAELQSRIAKSDPPLLEDLLQFGPNVMAYGGPDKAAKYAEMAVRFYPNSSAAYLMLAGYLPSDSPEGKERQRELLEQAIRLDMSSSAARSQLGWYYLRLGKHLVEAELEFRKALDISREQNADAWYGLAHVLSAQGQNKDAIQAYHNHLRLRKIPSANDAYVRREIERLSKFHPDCR